MAVTRPIRIPQNIGTDGLKRLLPKLEQLMRRQRTWSTVKFDGGIGDEQKSRNRP